MEYYEVSIVLAFLFYNFVLTVSQCTCDPEFCKNNGTCIVNETDCSFLCMCSKEFDGKQCENTVIQVSTPFSTTLRPVSSRTCMFGMMTCVHGYCRNGMMCACDENWTGAMCEKLKCPLSCDVCELKNDNVICIEETTNTKGITQALIGQELSTMQTTVKELKKDCLGGKTCNNGYCDSNDQNCICDNLWTGTLCDEPNCSLGNCSSKCQVNENSIQCFEDPILKTTEATTATKKNNTENEGSIVWTLEERTCLPGFFVCDHGYCKKEKIRFYCVCDPYWSGMFCKIPDCPHCSNGCEILDGSVKCKNVIETTRATPFNTSLLTEDDIVTTTTIGPINGTYPDGHACSENYTYTDDFCFGIPCKYGNCKYLESTPNNMKIQCSCDPGATGPTCGSKCCKICQQGICKIDNNGTEFCNCFYGYEGEFCEMKKKDPEEDTWYWWVVGICLGLIVLLILALVVLPYWMWRNRVILIMKIVHYFQRYEDNDDREWDAFISYKCDEKDEAFVLKQLYSKLEVEMGFRLCLHFRDFIPGDTISNNIIRAVQGSRRTIILLTPRYVQSEFTKFEYQMAQTEMLKRRHRIIPLVLEDISSVKESLDPNLEQIIHSVTYLEWPGDEESSKIQRFWKKLVLSMPKKKDVEERRKAMSSSSSSPSSYNFSSQSSEVTFVSDSSLSSSLSSKNKHVSKVSTETNTNGYSPSEPIKNTDIVIKMSDELCDFNKNEDSSRCKSNIESYLELIDLDSKSCSET